MSDPASRILLIADEDPPRLGALSPLLERADFRFHFASLANGPDALAQGDIAAALVVAGHPYFNGRQQELIHVLDALCARHVATVLVPSQAGDQRAADDLADTDGLMAVPHSCQVDELAGRLSGLVAAKPLLDALHRENQILRKFDKGLHNQMTQLDEEMRLAARLQTDFLPRDLPQADGCSFHVLFRPASYVSGDIYDVARLDEEHIGFYIADAVGHGMPAALLTIYIKRALKTKEIIKSGYRIVPPSEALAALNDDLLEQHLSQCQFVTMVYGIINTRTLELQYARAGHPQPLLLKRHGAVSELPSDGPLLGVFPGETFPLAKTQLIPGDAVLLYSDGFETAFGDPTDDASGNADVYRGELAALASPDPAERLARLADKLDTQAGSLHPRDDLTAVLLVTS
jgi:serine phosphatase RsbU (regulator of sigma subunit)